MKAIKGKTVSPGIAMGPVFVIRKAGGEVERTVVSDPQAEAERLKACAEAADGELGRLYDKALEEVGQDAADVFEAHQMMLEELAEEAEEKVLEDGVSAEYAVQETGKEQAQVFSEMEDEYMRARAADVGDVALRLIRHLSGAGGGGELKEPSIILAEDLTPGETIGLDKDKLLGFATVQGSSNSHTAILARMMSLPALIQAPMEPEEIREGTLAILDCETGELVLEPDDKTKEEAAERIRKAAGDRALLESLKGLETVTKSGKHIELAANIGNPSDMVYVTANDAEGIGLFRSEFLYLGREDYPSEEEQFNAYKQVLEQMGEKRVVIRTCDIGADKQVDYFDLPHEENPALGLRAIRICLKRPGMFKTQLRALLRAAVYGRLAVMYPMIISPEEVKRIKAIVEETAKELEAEGIAYAIPEQGIMIETPAAVMVSDELAKEVDFFSVGTNDLTQYTLAIDRTNDALAEFLDTHHPAVLRMIEMAAENAHRHGKWIGICGELGADEALTGEFLRMGIDELSVSPSRILGLRKKIREMD